MLHLALQSQNRASRLKLTDWTACARESQMITVEKMVREMRLLKGISQQHLANRIGVNKQFVSNFERETCEIPLKYFSIIAKTLGLDLKLMIEVRIANVSTAIREHFD